MGRPQITVQKINTLTGHRDCVYALAPSGEAGHFFSSGGDGQVAQWSLENPEDGRLVAKVTASVYALCYWPDKDYLIVGQNNDGLHLIDLNTRKAVGSLQLTKAPIFDIKVVGNTAWVADGAGAVHIVDLEELRVINKLSLSQQSARALAVHPYFPEIAVGYSDHHIRIIDAETHTVRQEWAAHDNSVFTLAYDPRGRWLLSGSRDARLKAWVAVEGEYSLQQEVVAHMYAINSIVYRPDGRYFATGSMDKAVKVWDADTLELLKVIDKARHAGHGTSVNKLLWSTFELQLVSGSDDRTVSVWDIAIEAQAL